MMKIDAEFRALIPPLTVEEFKQLEKNILEEGIRESILVWNDTIIDGHNRYEIATKHNLKYETIEKEFDSRDKVIEWMILNQFGRRNLSAYQRSILALRLKTLFEERAKEKQLSTLKQNTVPQKSWEREEKEEKDKIWNDKGFSYDTKVRLVDNVELKYGKLRGKEEKNNNNKVYIAKSEERLKIGISYDPSIRLEQLRIGCPDIELMFNIEGDKSIEKKAHKYFETYSIGGEWFKYSENILQKMIDYITRESKRTNETDFKLAKVAGVSHDTIAKVQKIEEKAPEEVKEKLNTGEISINQAYKGIKQEENNQKRKETLQTKAKELPAEKFQVIYCDPPWQYNNSGLNGSAESKYPTMPIEDLCKMSIKSIAAENAVIFMWATNPLLEDALKLMKAWGFEYKTNMVWVKENSNFGKLGFYIYGQHELLLIGVKGSILPIGEKPTSIITGNNAIHSRKPDSVYDIIESMYPELKYIELFARNTPRDGWVKWGNEVGKYE